VFVDWQEAEREAEEAASACAAIYKAGRRPSTEQLDELLRLRIIASEKMRAMVADAKSCNP
jgi:hypothetical protein